MADRIMKVNAYTTFDLLDGEARGHDWSEEALAVMDVRVPKENPNRVVVQLELDNTQLEHLPPHADSVNLTADQARELAAQLDSYAARVDGDDEHESE